MRLNCVVAEELIKILINTHNSLYYGKHALRTRVQTFSHLSESKSNTNKHLLPTVWPLLEHINTLLTRISKTLFTNHASIGITVNYCLVSCFKSLLPEFYSLVLVASQAHSHV